MTRPIAGKLSEALESIRAFSKERGIVGADDLYEMIDAGIRKTIDQNQGVQLGNMVHMFQNILVGFSSSICAFYATSVIDNQQDDFVETFERRFVQGLRAAVPELIEAIERNQGKQDEHTENTRVGGLH